MSKTLLFIIQIITPLLLVAQTADNFSDGDFTQNPTWTGTTDKFIVDNQVLRLNDNVAGTSFLATPNTFLDNAQWDIWVRIAFTPSNNNHPLIYLVSDSPNLTGPLNGYFIRIGKDGTDNKRIYFTRQTGTTSTEILVGADNIATATNNLIRIRVRRDHTGTWSIFADPTGGHAFAPQGSISDMTHTSTQWFGMVCRYTSTNANRFYFDDIYVGPIIVDNIPPAITSLVVTSANTLQVNFSEPLNSASALNPANYFVDNGIGNPVNVAFLPGSTTNVALTFGSPFVSGQTNTLSVQNIGDLSGNFLTLSTNQFHWYVPKRFDVVFNEIMADPTPQVGLPAHEYVELYNNSLFDINLQGWVLQHGTTTRTITSGSIRAGGFAVLTTTAALPEFASIPNVIAISGLSSTALLNDGTTLTLSNSQNELIDRVSYTSQWYGDISKNLGGWSLERIDPLNICGESDNWRAAISPLGGTPGVINSVNAPNRDTTPPILLNVTIINSSEISLTFNEKMDENTLFNPSFYTINQGIGHPVSVSVSPTDQRTIILNLPIALADDIKYTIELSGQIADCPGNAIMVRSAVFSNYKARLRDVVFNEIMADPTPQVGLPAHEYIELYNNSLFDINLQGWVLQHGTTTPTITSGSIPAGGFAVLTTSAALPEFASTPNVIVISGLSSTALLNDGTTLTLSNSQNELIDRVSYSSLWYGDTSKNQGGWSLERIDPLNICGESDNWRAAINPLGGTPGVINSVRANNPDNTPPLLQGLRILNPLELSLTFNEIMDESTLVNPGFYTINQGIGQPISASVSPTDQRTVTLILPLILPDDLIFNIELSNQITDCAGNAIQVRNTVFTTYKAKRFDIVFSELMADPTPAVALPEHRYIEFYNTTDFPINLEGWRLVHGSTQRELPPIVVPPKGYAVITTQSAFPFFRDYANVFAVPGLSESFLTNSGQTLSLIKPEGELISWVAYNDTWYGDPSKSEGGWSLEKIDPYNYCAGSSNWRASIDSRGGTPGSNNSIRGSNPDQTMPSLLRAGWESGNRVSLFFDETIVESQLTNPANFFLDNGIGHPLTVNVLAPQFMRADIILATDLLPGIIYTVNVAQDLADCAGNAIAQNTARVAVPLEPDSMDIVINEILFNPPDRGQRYIEIYNRSTKVIDLRHMIISSKDTIGNFLTSIQEITVESNLIFPEDYKVITPAPEVVKSQFLTSNPGGFITSLVPSMTNANGVIVLATRGQKIIDQFVYNENMHHPLLSTNKGVSLERLNYHRPTQDRSNWHSAAQSVGFGTPGFKNSQFTLNIGHRGDEIQIYPKIFSPDNDGRDDLLNISYIFDTPGYTANINIYDSKGRLVRVLRRAELLSVQGVITWDGVTNENLKAPIGIYVIFIEAYSPAGNVKTYRKTAVLGGKL